VGRVRALETQLLDNARIERMLDADDPQELLRILQDTPYGVYVSDLSGPLDFERMLGSESKRSFELFSELCLNPRFEAILRAKYDFHNLKVMLKSSVAEQDFSYALLDLGTLGADDLKDIFTREDYASLASHLQSAVERGIEAYYEKRDPQRLDLAVDRAMYGYLTGTSVTNTFLRSYYRLEIDLTNLSTLVRLKVLEREDLLRYAVLDGGFLRIEDYFGDSLESLPERLFVTPYYFILREGLAQLKSADSFARLERLADEFLYGFLSLASRVDLGPEPLLAFLLKKLYEIKILRMVLVGVLNRAPKEMMRERIPSV
jgi:V/A-type H+-transporting ATPase subunit C